MKRKLKTQTRLEVEAVQMADYVWRQFANLRTAPVDLAPKQALHRLVQKYLDDNAYRNGDNQLTGIIAIQDIWKHSTGGRVHLVVGLTGPLVESLRPPAVRHPIDYENRSRIFVKAITSVSEEKPPWAGNIHFHLWHATKHRVQMSDVLEFLRKEHGFQNDLQQLADVRPFVFVALAGQPYWRPANNDVVNRALQAPVLQTA